MNRSAFKLAVVSAFVVTSYVTFTLVAVNVGLKNDFLFRWFQSWLIAFILVVPSLIFVGPFIKKKLNL